MKAQDFEKGLEENQAALRTFAYKFTNENEAAKDLLQETYLKALKYRSKFQEKTNLSAWLFTIMRNTFINNYRRAMRANVILDTTDDQYFINSTNVRTNEWNPESIMNVDEIQLEIERMEDVYRIPFQMYQDGFKYKEIAEELDLPIGTVKSRIFFARKKLAAQFAHLR